MARLDGLTQAAAHGVMAAARALDAGRVDEASQHMADALNSHPTHPEVLRMLAGIEGMRGKHQAAIRTMRQALEQRPNDAVYHNTMATLLGNAGEYDQAIAALRRTCGFQPDMAIAWYNLGVMLTRSVRNDEAVVALQRAVALAPDLMSARALLADLLRMRGSTEEAATEYRRVLAQQPWAGMAWWGLADLRTLKFSEDDVASMQQALHNPASSDDDLIAIGFALAKALDDSGHTTESLAALTRANALARRRQQWDRAGYSSAITALQQAFTPAPAGAPETLGSEVIFIVGLPRSGSTLVEQVLASHSAVTGAGELPDLPLVLAEESRRRGQPFPRWVDDMQPADWERLGRRYLERTAHWRQDR
ncbi:MAG TPA: tetratricopeptide repeat protein, partial [Rhodanobacter sp.]